MHWLGTTSSEHQHTPNPSTPHPTPAVHCPVGWQGTRWPQWQQRWPCDSCPSPAGPAASCSCHITILPGACPNNRHRCGGSSRMVVALPAEPVTRDPPQPHGWDRCPVLSHEPGTDPQWSLLGSPSPSGMLIAHTWLQHMEHPCPCALTTLPCPGAPPRAPLCP